MTLRSAVDQEIRDLIQKHGRITFARVHAGLPVLAPRRLLRFQGPKDRRPLRDLSHESPGFRGPDRTPTGANVAPPRRPSRFPCDRGWFRRRRPGAIHRAGLSADGPRVGSGALLRRCGLRALLASIIRPRRRPGQRNGMWMSSSRPDATLGVQRVRAEGLRAFRNVVGCILSNELIDNFPVHRFAIQGGRVKEVFVTLAGGNLTEVLDEPSSPRIEEQAHRAWACP